MAKDTEKGKAPAFQFYAADFATDTAAWLNSEVGIYMRLLCHQWINGHVPADERRLARLVGEGIKDFKEAWEVVGEKFVEVEPGKLQNRRLERVRRERDEYIKSQSEAGRRGAMKRWGGHGNGNGPDGGPNGDPSGNPISDPNGGPNGESYGEHHGEKMALQSSSSVFSLRTSTSASEEPPAKGEVIPLKVGNTTKGGW